MNSLTILHLEDSAADVELIDHTLRKEFPGCTITSVQTQSEFETFIKSMKFDLVLSDFTMPNFNGLEAMRIIKNLDPEIPFIFVSGHIGEDLAIEALKEGATDYVLKDRLTKLVPAVKRVLREKQERQRRLLTERALVQSEKKYKTLFESATDAIFLMQDLKYTDCNLKATEMFRASKEQIIGKTLFEFSPQYQLDGSESFAKGAQKIKDVLSGNPQFFEWRHKRFDGEEFDTEINLNHSKIDGEIVIQAIIRDITERKEAEAKINLLFRAIEQSPVSVIVTNTAGNIEYVNPKFSDLTGYSKEESIGKNPRFLKSGIVPKETYMDLWEKITSGKEWRGEFIDRKKSGEFIVESAVISPVINAAGKITAYLAVKEDITLRRQMEDALKQSEERFRSIFEISPVGIASIDRDGKFISVNKAVERILGYSEEELKSKSIRDITYSHDVEKSLEFLDRLINQPLHELSFEKRYNKKGGQLIWARLTVSGVYNEKKEFLYTITMIEDITRWKEYELALKKSEEKYRNLFEKNLAGVYRNTLDGKILEANSAFAEIMGFSSIDEVLRINAVSFYTDEKEREKIVTCIVRDREIKNVELQWYDKNKNIKWVMGNSSLMEDDKTGEKYLISTLVDITDRKKIEDALRQSEEKYRDLVENIHDIIFSMDLTGVMQYVSPAIEDVLGYKPEEIIGKNIDALIKDSRIQIVNEQLEKVSAGHAAPVEFDLYTKSGEPKWVRISEAPIIVKGKAVGLRGVISDITEKKNAERELIAAKENAEEMNRLKSNFLANMSHELRTPMVGILGGADFLRDNLEEFELKEMARIIYDSGTRLLNTLNLLLDISRIEADKVEINYTELEINTIIREAVAVFQKFSESKGLYIKLEPHKNPIILKSDERMLREILNNLINNALKFTSAGGVTISTSVSKNKNNLGSSAVIKIADTGIGIPKDKINLIFEEFRQISEGFSRQFEGTGLGLTITKKFVELLQGDISVKNNKGKGSVFTVRLPLFGEVIYSGGNYLAEDETISEIKPATLKNISEREYKIIYLEDDDVSKQIVNSHMKDVYNLYLANNRNDFMEKICATKFDLILLDINLGTNESGIELLKDIRQIKMCEHIPVVAITAYAMKGDREHFLEAGFSDYLSKPFTKNQLLKTIESYLP